MNEPLEKFLDTLLLDKGVTAIDEALLAQMKSDLRNRVEDRINATLLKNLPPEKLSEFENLLDSGAKEEHIQQFCKTAIPELDSLIAATLLDFRQTYLHA